MSIQSEITRITNKRDASLAAVAAKGVTVPSGSTIDDLPGLIAQIEATGVSVVTTQDSHGGDIVTITGTPISPYTWIGPDAELLETYNMGSTTLADTGFNTWTPSTTATTIQATSNLGTKALDTANYEYALKWQYEANIVYASGTTLAGAPIKQLYEIVQNITRRPSSFAGFATKTDETNYCATLYTASLMDYYKTNGDHALTWTGGYGIYAAATAATFSSSSGTTPTLTIKAPVYNARCSTTYFTTNMASAVDKANSTITCKGYLYRVGKYGPMYSMYHDLVDMYDA